VPADTDRGPGRAEAPPGLPPEGLFHQPIFQGVVGEHHQPVSRTEKLHPFGYQFLQAFGEVQQVALGGEGKGVASKQAQGCFGRIKSTRSLARVRHQPSQTGGVPSSSLPPPLHPSAQYAQL